MKLKSIKFLIFILLSFSIHYVASACRCADTMGVFPAYLHASHVYVGKVIEIRDSAHYKEVTFKVSQNLKHTYKSSITLRIGHTSCDWRFHKDSTYLVYASLDKQGFLHTNLCSRTKLFSSAVNELKELHAHDMMDCKVLLPVEPAEQCTEKYDPVCGCDGQTYGNPCIAHNNGINHWIWGECRNLKK